MISRRHFSSLALGATALTAGIRPAFAQGYAKRPVTFIMPFGAGGSGDTIARLLAAFLERKLAQPVNVINRTGGSGVVGHTAIAEARPDGYTIGLAPLELITMNLQGLTKLTYRDYTPLGYIASIASGLTVNAGSAYQNAAQLIEAIKSSPKGKLLASGTVQGGAYHIALGQLLASLGLPADHVRWVPSNGAATAYQDLAAGGIDFCTAALTEARSLIDAGRIRPLAILAPERSKVFADVPTIREVTGRDVEGGTWFSILGPKGIPAPIQQELAGYLEAFVQTPEFGELSIRLGLTPRYRGPEALEAFWAHSEQELAPLQRQLGLVR